jgi:hypothetical protein
MDPFRDSERQRELKAEADGQRHRYRARALRARLKAIGVLGLSVCWFIVGRACEYRLWHSKWPDGRRKFVPSDGLIELCLYVSLAVPFLAIYTVSDLRRTKQSMWIGIAAIAAAIIDIGSWLMTYFACGWLHIGIPH